VELLIGLVAGMLITGLAWWYLDRRGERRRRALAGRGVDWWTTPVATRRHSAARPHR
jgi:hypothetical protein